LECIQRRDRETERQKETESLRVLRRERILLQYRFAAGVGMLGVRGHVTIRGF
jgi:hypothetical protein